MLLRNAIVDPDLAALVGARARALASAPNVVALLASLAVKDGSWRLIPWEQVDSATWSDAGRQLRLTLAGGEILDVSVSKPSRLPEVIQERVLASIVFATTVSWPGHAATIAKRRGPAAPDDAGEWRIAAAPGTDPNDPHLLAELARIQAEYE
ncbi:MAG: hypothetical protein LBR58_06560 [Propionibacteriaceae bacterium]|jgi:hypothetical protein|nr:hypothetical protein [Propionibacteriaceae bacterium]